MMSLLFKDMPGLFKQVKENVKLWMKADLDFKKKIKGEHMTFVFKHPKYYEELRKQRRIEEEKESENNQDKDPSEQSQDPQTQE